MTDAAGHGSDPCPACGHPEGVHVVFPADATSDGWAHCTVGTGATACRCWREWPRLAAAPTLPDTVEVVPVAIDRTPAAHDWRYVVRAFGKVLIATGLLLGGFVAYQLWGTGIEARRAQNELEDEFESVLASTTTAISPVSTTPPDTASDTAPDTAPSDTAPNTAPATAPSDTVAPITVPIAAGDPIARLEIPEIGLDVVVVSGVSVDDLRRGPGHYPDTPLPGEYGNSAIAGHRTTYGQPFHDVDDLEPGDEIVVTTIAGRFVYAVTGTEIVDPGDTHVVATTDPGTAQLTLTSCHPKWSAQQRIIVRSALVADQSDPVGPPPTNGTPTATSPTVSSPSSPSVSSPSTSFPSTSFPSTSFPSTSTSPTAPTATTAGGGPNDTPTVTTPSADAFADGWFHDRSAIPQVALWALVVMAIAVGAHLLGRRVGHRLVGIGVGTLPFLIALYFFYQNVNRLLPPSL